MDCVNVRYGNVLFVNICSVYKDWMYIYEKRKTILCLGQECKIW